ncbi:Trimethyllysine dioxygenase, partial [Hondaea fermentalgiana]
AAPAAVASVEAGEDGLHVRFADGAEHRFDACWLRDNCKCERCMSQSGQKHDRTILPGSRALDMLNCEVLDDGETVTIAWRDHHGEEVEYEASWLRRFAYSHGAIEDEQASRAASFYHAERTSSKTFLPEVNFADVMASDAGVWDWVSRLEKDGFCMIRETPVEEGTVKKVANLVGSCSHAIYGETFDVKATPKPINIAYSDKALEPHMDLAYYESPPGVQFLHCLRFDEGVKGGDSTLIDAHAVAEEFKLRHPEHFHILSTVPATFQKDHVDREFPVRMFYQRPHIHTNYLGEVTACFWAPPFEGPLRVREDFVEPYYRAYHAFRTLLMSKEMWDKYGFLFRLRPGDLITFNNRRMLHGRNAFTSETGARHLQGCYLDADTFLNKFRVMSTTMSQDVDILGCDERFGTSSHR